MANKKQNAFTIVELLVAMALLVMLMALSGLVFNTSVKAFRTGSATVEMTRNLRIMTEQLTADFQGLQTSAPLFIAFNYDPGVVADPNDDKNYDLIHFFANGDFQTSKQYYDGSGNKTVSGNMARILYGHANTGGINYADRHILARKSHILTSDAGIISVNGQVPLITNSGGVLDYSEFAGNFGVGIDENLGEFNTITLTNWINALNYLDPANSYLPLNADTFIYNCMINAARPMIDFNNSNTLHLLMAQGIVQMQIQWAYTYDDLIDPTAATGYFEGVRWWPGAAADRSWPNINATVEIPTGSDFDNMTGGNPSNPFGTYFNLPNGTNAVTNWFAIQNCGTEIASTGTFMTFRDTFYPKALKFTFLVKDSKDIFNEGKTFTHIVYLDN